MNVWQFFSTHRTDILLATREHLLLVLISMAIAVAISVPLGLALVSRPRLRSLALAIANIFQTIPSLALFGFLIPLPFIGGIGTRTAVIALVLYALLPILRNTYVGLTGIDPAILEAAEAMGMTETQILFRVRLRHRHHRGGHWRRRPRYIHFSRSRNGQQRGDTRWRNSGRAAGIAGGFSFGRARAQIASCLMRLLRMAVK